MDGFYVAKIKKLSDKRPEDNVKEPSQVPDKEEVEVGMEVEKGRDEDKEPKHKSDQKTKKGKKRSAEDERKAEKRRKKGAKMSFPPIKKHSRKKKKLNAKVTQPRRKKVSTTS